MALESRIDNRGINPIFRGELSSPDKRKETRDLIEKITGAPFDPDLLKNYPYHYPEFAQSNEELRERFVNAFMTLEDLEPGLGNKTWEGSSKNLRKISKYNTSCRALSFVYNGPDESIESSPEAIVMGRMGLALPNNAQGVRYRGLEIQRVFKNRLADFSPTPKHPKFRILGIAAGSGDQLQKAIAASNRASEIEYTMVDKSKTAGADALALARKLGIEDSVRFQALDVVNDLEDFLSEQPAQDLNEAGGIFDYLYFDECVKVLKAAEKNTVEGGIAVYTNIIPNPEIDFLEKVVAWLKMKYRYQKELREMGQEAGFKNIRVFEEPARIYNIVTAQKAA